MGKKGFGQSHVEKYNTIGMQIQKMRDKIEKEFPSPCINCKHNDSGYCYLHHAWCEKAKIKCIKNGGE